MSDYPIQDRTFHRLLLDKAARNGARDFLRFEDRRYSYAETERLTRVMANRFRELGVGHGSHVATLMNNCPELLFAYFALVRLGAVVVPVNTASRGDILVYYLEQSRSTMLLAEQALVERFQTVRARLPELRQLIVFDEGGSGIEPADALDFRALLHGSDAPFDSPARFCDLSHISYTSGTTGPSKGNMATHAHTIAQGKAVAEAYGYRSDDVLFTCLPLLHGNALLACVVPAIWADATVALSRRFSASAFWGEVRRLEATQFNLLGAMVNIVWSQPESPADREHRVRQCMVVPIPTDFYEAFERRFGLTFTSLYALTDFGMAALKGPEAPRAKLGAAGLPAPGMRIRIVDEDDMPLPPGEVGEIVLRSDEPWFAPLGYYDMPEATLAAWRNLWFHTGDRGYLDADGWLYFVDRKKDAIRRRGQNISSYEVEQILLRHPAVQDVAIYAVRSEMSEDEVMATVVLKPGGRADERELIAFCQENMSYFMVPRYLEFRDDMPRTASEKVQKYKLREEAEARLGELWDREKAGIRLKK
jgi:carnitine-CoA ligase